MARLKTIATAQSCKKCKHRKTHLFMSKQTDSRKKRGLKKMLHFPENYNSKLGSEIGSIFCASFVLVCAPLSVENEKNVGDPSISDSNLGSEIGSIICI